ncbi:protein-disulfide reductase DsbD [Novosphingobium sp. FKTRR1]|uniref:protein-disulfide reductase DsbD family protein n=1 Tax=Novosphingobium sp. FKTRR1 TaxID=2879118 RepID=UPI001CF00472|nr:protein-disulfide reductase DsbD domain-containing protein [Novosphingobium sp. FKTRR1]
MFVTALWLALGSVAAQAERLDPAAPSHIRASLVAERPAAPGETIQLAVLMQPAANWHGYWSNPGDAGLPLLLDWTLPKGAKAGDMRFPVPQTLLIAGLMNHVYEHDFAVLVPFTLPADAKPGQTLALSAKAQWLACTTTICVPEEATLTGSVVVGSGAADPRFEGWRAALPAPLDRAGVFSATPQGLRLAIPFPASAKLDQPHFFIDGQGVIDYAAPQVFTRQGDWLLVDLARPKGQGAEQATRLSGVLALGKAAGGIALTASAGPLPAGADGGAATGAFSLVTLALAVLGALAGGLVLNVMPCVFPILSLKALALARGNSEHARTEGLAYTAGVVLACLALGGAMLALRAAGEQVGWAFQLQDPGVVALLLLLAVAITANFAGLYELPGLSLEGGAPGKHGAWGSFGTGLLAAFVATPCTGPFMAAAVGAALVLPTWAALAVFAALGFGLALPFLLIGFVPALRKLLPRPGGWMNTFRRAMAVPMGLTVLALAWLAWRLGGPGYAALVLALAALLVLTLVFAGRGQSLGKPVARLVVPAVVVLAAVGLGIAPRLVSADHGSEASAIGAQPFSEAALAKARASGKPVFAYFTADWCLTCKVNEGVAIETDATRDAFRKAGVVVLVGDWTRRDAAISRFLTTQGAGGVPLYLWYPAHGEAQKLQQVLTPDTLTALVKH